MNFKFFKLKKIFYLLFLISFFALNFCNISILAQESINAPQIIPVTSNVEDKTLDQIRQERKSSQKSLISPVSVLANLITLIIIMLFLAWIYNKYGKNTLSKVMAAKSFNPDSINILSSASIGQGKYLHVIEVDKKRILIGATTTQITFLQTLSDKLENMKKEENNE